jgi:hypothetical protein
MLKGSIEIQGRVSFLANQLTTDLGILRLSNGLLIDTVNFIQRLVGYMGEEQLWELLVSFIEQVFEDLWAARCIIQDASEGESSLLLWGIMRAHDVMEEYIKHDFSKHPALNGILVQRILRSSPTSGIYARVQSVEKAITSINGTLPGVKTRLSAVEVKTVKL